MRSDEVRWGGGTRAVKASMENQQARSDPPTPHTGGGGRFKWERYSGEGGDALRVVLWGARVGGDRFVCGRAREERC